MLNLYKIDMAVKGLIHKIRCQKLEILCLSLYCLLSSGCGKAVKTDEAGDSDVRRPGLNSSVITLTNSSNKIQTNTYKYTFKEVAEVYIPEKIHYISGNTNEFVRVHYAKDDLIEAVYCLYENTDNIDHDLEFVDCYRPHDDDGDGLDDSLNYQAGYTIILGADAHHTLELEADNTRVQVEGSFDVDWH